MMSSPIAIVGMAGRFPGARNIDEFWRNLRDGVESIRPLSDGELLAAGVAPELLGRPDYVKAAAVLDDVDRFDAAFFGFSPRDAAIMDPQHRHFLECAWEALENAGHPPERFSGSIGVFAGSGMNAYLIHNLLKNRALVDSAGLFLIRQTGNDKDVLASRVSYQLDLHGPSLSVQTACSTSLVAVHLACQSLLGGECDMALAGGVTIEIPHSHGYIYREGEILSRDGHCRAFDAASSGTIFSSGVGIVVLRRLEDAIEDHDTIYAVILGSAVNNDGQRKVGYLAPSVAGQAEAITEALGVAGTSVESISYVETHGTGTAVGDPLEIKALTQAFRADTARTGYCAIGSLKTNVGHLDTAAGVAGLIKAVLALKHRQLPPSLNFEKANPRIDFANSPFYVNTALRRWEESQTPRRAGVTSLGIGGTNAHVVLQEAPAAAEAPQSESRFELIPVSAKSEGALSAAASRLSTYLVKQPDLRLEDVAFTCQLGRKAFRHRYTVVARTPQEAALLLAARQKQDGSSESARSSESSVAFLFPGQGSHFVNMGADLYANQPVFRSWLDRCARLLRPHLDLDRDLTDSLYPSPENELASAADLNRTSMTQPALFCFEYALAQWWLGLGVRPRAMLGHSIGEYVAACLADVFSLEDALAIVAYRGRLMERCAAGAMLAVPLPPTELVLPAKLSLAAVNAPEQSVVSGPTDAVALFQRQLGERGVPCRRLQTSGGFHSAILDPILDSFAARMRQISLRPPKVRYLSNLTGTWITEAEATDPEYWAKQLRNTVRFSDCVTELLRDPGRVLVEVGPGQSLAGLARLHTKTHAAGANASVYCSLPRREATIPETAFLLETLGQLWRGGQEVDWSVLHRGKSVTRIPLPTYPFQRQRFWIEPDQASEPRAREPTIRSGAPAASPSAELAEAKDAYDARRNGIDHWFYQRTWHRVPHQGAAPLAPACWLVMDDNSKLGEQVRLQLESQGHDVIEVIRGATFKRAGGRGYLIRPGVREDYDALFADLASRDRSPQRIVHLWSIGDDEAKAVSLDERLDGSFYSLLFLAQAIAQQDLAGIDIAVVSNRLFSVAGERACDPVAATLLGPTRVIAKELPAVICRSIDVDTTADEPAPLAAAIIAEHGRPFRDSVVAIRGGDRFGERFEPLERIASPSATGLRKNGVYLITGGLGDIGLVIAEELARQFQARLVLLGRTPLPPAQEWEAALDASSAPDRIKGRIGRLRKIQSLGARVLHIACDVCDFSEMQRAIALAHEKFGSINGVFHAAGVIDDAPLLAKSRASAAAVLDPKVKGTMVLDQILRELQPSKPPDFIALSSSVSSVLAPAGQVDYAASNAFLDAFAAKGRGSRVVAINWGPWQDVGMAARARAQHPLLGRRLVESGDRIAYSTLLSCDRHWALAEHTLRSGKAVLPGTAYLEMACAGLTRGAVDHAVEFADVFFHAPLFADPSKAREVRVELNRQGDGAWGFSVKARAGDWVEHASGRIARCQQPPPPPRMIEPIGARCHERVLTFDDSRRTRQEEFFAFGPRWHCLKRIDLGKNEALAELALPSAFQGDRSDYRLHPALLDLATGSALYLIEDYGRARSLYFPMFYRRAVIYRPIPGKLFSHIRSTQRNEAGGDVATFDLTLLDPEGKVVGEIEGFSMRQVRDPQEVMATAGAEPPASGAQPAPTEDLPQRGIAPADGATAFVRIVSSDGPAGVFVLPDGPAGLSVGPPRVASANPAPSGPSGPDDVEAVMAGWWQEMLGLDHVGLDDDFFDLGGQSLIVVRLVSKIKKTFGAEIGLSSLFEARTIRALSQLVRESSTQAGSRPASADVLIPIQATGTRLPLFLIGAADSDVRAFRPMAAYLGADQPVYGLSSANEHKRAGEPALGRVQEIAASHVEAILAQQAEGPIRLLGDSPSGAIAFEVAEQLRARGRVVSLLSMLDSIEPRFNRQFAATPGFRRHSRGEESPREQSASAPSRLWRRLLAASAGSIRRILPASRPFLAGRNGTSGKSIGAAPGDYRPKVYPGTLTLFRAETDGPGDGDGEFLNWGEFVAGGVHVYPVPSPRGQMLQDPGVRVLAEKLRECLDR